jgi:(S)-2-hydroxyglutarate dehydrogenase
VLVVPTTYDFLVVGTGIIGISIARELRRRHGARVLVIDKESGPGQHASGRNSGVLHAGVYYKSGTLKARLCIEGNRRMKHYCRAKAIPMNEHGKVIVTRNESEIPTLDELHQRAKKNGAAVALLDHRDLKEVEPCARTVGQALYVKDTAVVNPQRVMESISRDAVEEGVEFRFRCAWLGSASATTAKTSQGTVAYGHLVNCAGLYADQISHGSDVGRQYRVLPFRGQFYLLRPESKIHVRGNIYPVPDLRNPFLGVHFTRRPEGEVTVGPSALPLLGREQYRGLMGANIQDGVAMLKYLLRLFGRNRDHFRSIAWREMTKLSRRGFFREAEQLGHGLQECDLLPGKDPGIRAQLVDTRTAELVNDFVVEPGPRSTHVLNAVSPTFTCSFPFAEYVIDRMKLEG